MLFLAGIDLPLEQREAFLDEQCHDDLQLREEVLSLLRHDAAEESPLLDAISAGAASILTDDPPHGRILGPYRIEREIGRGGMAVVYLAWRADGEFQKRVAVKLIKRGMDTAAVIERLRRERRILAALEHPSIARLLDGGTTADGRPWIAMEYIEGLPIQHFCEEQHLTTEERCLLMGKVCDAVAYAHRHLVVHRDLKPSNILIAADGNPKLLDFGIAKLLSEDEGEREEPLTRGRWLPLTPEYASPEQMQGTTVTTATDVYSLGMVLYEVLTGERPDPGRTQRRLASDLENIVRMALREDVSRRYGSVEQLADDIRRYLQGLPVQARGDSLLYRSGKFLGRNRTAAAAGFLVAAAVIAGAAIDIRQAHAARERFDQMRGFARTVLVDLHAQLKDIPGTAKARQTLVTYVDEYLKQVAAKHAGDDRALATEFATTYLRLGEMQGATEEAIASFENGRRLLEHSSRNPAETLVLARLHVREGSTQLELGRGREGVENLVAGASLANGAEGELVKAFAQWRLARLYRTQNRLQESEEQARTAIATCQENLRRGIRTKEIYEILTGARNVLGSALRREGRWRESLETEQTVLADTEQRAQAEPESASLQRALARSHQIVGDMVVRMPGHDEQEVRLHVRRAIAIAERLAALDPGDLTAQGELAQYLSSGAETLRLPEDSKEALGYMRRALPIFETLLKSEPGNDNLRLYAALTEADIGVAMGSAAWLRRGMADLIRLVESDRANVTNWLELIKVQEWLSLSLARGGGQAEAIGLARDAIAKARLLGDATVESRRELPRAYAAMAATCGALGKREEARQWYRAAVAEWEKVGSSPDSEEEIAEARRGAGKY